MRPVITYSSASRVPTVSASARLTLPPGGMPQLTSERPKVASSAAIARSQEIIGVNPPPKHQPLTIAIVGFGNSRRRRHCQPIESRRTLRWR